jgi:hypothetical protein
VSFDADTKGVQLNLPSPPCNRDRAGISSLTAIPIQISKLEPKSISSHEDDDFQASTTFIPSHWHKYVECLVQETFECVLPGFHIIAIVQDFLRRQSSINHRSPAVFTRGCVCMGYFTPKGLF